MSERYTKLAVLPENLYAQGAPVIIAAGAMLRGNARNQVLVQLKFRSIAAGKTNIIRAVKVHIEPLDTAYRPMDCAMDYQYLDLNVARGEEFGAQTPVYLSDPSARSFRVSVSEVILSDGIWASDGSTWEPLSAPTSVEDFCKNAELAKQYLLKYGSDCRVLPRAERGLWYCACGTLNRDEEATCCSCQRGRGSCFTPVDIQELQAETKTRLDAERAEAEKRRQEGEAKAAEQAKQAAATAKKIRKTAAIAAVVALVAAGAFATVKYVIIPNRDYKAAMSLYESGDYDAAIAAFQVLGEYKDSAERVAEAIEIENPEKYAAAEELLNSGESAQAAYAFYALGDYKDAYARCMEIWDDIAVRETVSAGSGHTVAINADGTVVATGWNKNGQCHVSSWKDIVAVSAGIYHTVGLKSDGTVVATGWNEYGQSDVSSWKDIVAIAANGIHTVGLKANGTAVAVGSNDDGHCDVSDWTDIIAISTNFDHTVGLKTDGTVVAVGSNNNGECDVSGWKDIVAIAADGNHTVGLKSDGTVVATGWNEDGQSDVSSWKDIVAVSAGDAFTVGLKKDGTVVTVGSNSYGQCDVSNWTEIKIPEN